MVCTAKGSGRKATQAINGGDVTSHHQTPLYRHCVLRSLLGFMTRLSLPFWTEEKEQGMVSPVDYTVEVCLSFVRKFLVYLVFVESH